MAQPISRIRQLAGETELQAGEMIYRRGGVRELLNSPEYISYLVMDDPKREVTFSMNGPMTCGCDVCRERGACRHIVAAAMLGKSSGVLENLYTRKAQTAGPKLLNTVDAALSEESPIRLEVNLIVEPSAKKEIQRAKIGLRVGEERLYVVRSIPQFIEAMENGQPMEFGKGFSFRPSWMRFGETQTRILELLRMLCLAQRDVGAGLHGADNRHMTLPDPYVGRILALLKDTSFKLTLGESVISVKRVRSVNIPLHFNVSSSLQTISVLCRYPDKLQPLTKDCAYVLVGENVVEVPAIQRRMLHVLWQEELNGASEFEYPMTQVGQVVGELIPTLKLTGAVEIAPEFDRLLIKRPLESRVYLDRDGAAVVARTEFWYGDRRIDPFNEQPMEQRQPGEKLLLRDAAAERQVLDVLGSCGFFVGKGLVYLSGNEAIFNFVNEGLTRLLAICQVYPSNDFRKLKPRKPALRGQMRMNNHHLELQFTEDGEPAEEILAIMEALSRRRRYFRLKDGSFLDLSGMEEWQPLADSVYEAATLENGASVAAGDDVIVMRSFRTCYLSSLLEACHLPVEQDESVLETVRAMSAPEEENVLLPGDLSLRPYQRRGFQWLHTLDRLHMGGILADDMGLGKTVQVIALLKATREPGKTSLVVSPTSLTYNWLSELNRFAPELSVMVLGGTSAQRASQIQHVRTAHDVDVLITSYPLIRRDIELMNDMPFRFAILDEAQQIKNAGSVSALAVKQLKAETRFALTGTPMENGAGELWSIFDYVLPGYLNGYNAFLRRYQDGQDLDDLRRRIRPFLMRRLKKDVLTELPDKNETILTAQMTPEQAKVYQSAMLRLRDRVDHVMAEKGLGRGRTEVLAAITELRQICCHPDLVLEGYDGSSGKLDLLMDILPGAIAGGRRVLIFSQFTTMLKILLRKLEVAGYACMYLDGDTPPSRRVEMTERFNGGQGQIFLISLKAGGTGLNLTGADMVIHYDPWWNPAAEDQATDRAHRIGQTRKVDVVRLVTHSSIEEQVVELGQRKKALFDQLITPGEELVTALTEADIRALFA